MKHAGFGARLYRIWGRPAALGGETLQDFGVKSADFGVKPADFGSPYRILG